MSWDDTTLMRLELYPMSALKYTDGIMRFGPQFNRLTVTKVELFVVSVVLAITLQESHSRIRDVPLCTPGSTVSVWKGLWCRHTSLLARPSALTYNRMRKRQHLLSSGSHGLFQDSSVCRLSWSRHKGVAIYFLKHTKATWNPEEFRLRRGLSTGPDTKRMSLLSVVICGKL